MSDQPFTRADRNRIRCQRPNAVRCWNGRPITRRPIVLDALCHVAGVRSWREDANDDARWWLGCQDCRARRACRSGCDGLAYAMNRVESTGIPFPLAPSAGD